MTTSVPDIVIVGHFCYDLVDGAYILGGGASYTSLAARALGYKVGVVTSVPKDFQFWSSFEGIEVVNVVADEITIFENIYDEEGNRRQLLHARGGLIGLEHIPEAWRKAKAILLCPIARELKADIASGLEAQWVGCCLQGWLRHWGADKRVFPVFPKQLDFLTGVDLNFCSYEDIDYREDRLASLREKSPYLIVTNGANGADLFAEQKRTFAAFPANVLDPTGAGDVFAITFLAKLQEGAAMEAAMVYANAGAAYCIEGKGTSKLATAIDLEARFSQMIQAQ